MKSSTPYWIGLGSSEQDDVELPERTVIMALAFYTLMAMAVYILMFGLYYLFFCQPAKLLRGASTSPSSDAEPTPKNKKRKAAKKNKKKKSVKRSSVTKSKASAKSVASSSSSSDSEPTSKEISAKRNQVKSKVAAKRKLMAAQLLRKQPTSSPSSSSSDSEVEVRLAMTKEPGPPGEEDNLEVDLDVILDKTGEDPLATNVKAQVYMAELVLQVYIVLLQVHQEDMEVQTSAESKGKGEAEVRGRIKKGQKKVIQDH